MNSCKNCSHKYNNSCTVINRIGVDYDSFADEVHQLFEEGVIDDIMTEHLDFSELFEEIKEEGFLKKNVDVKNSMKIISRKLKK